MAGAAVLQPGPGDPSRRSRCYQAPSWASMLTADVSGTTGAVGPLGTVDRPPQTLSRAYSQKGRAGIACTAIDCAVEWSVALRPVPPTCSSGCSYRHGA